MFQIIICLNISTNCCNVVGVGENSKAFKTGIKTRKYVSYRIPVLCRWYRAPPCCCGSAPVFPWLPKHQKRLIHLPGAIKAHITSTNITNERF